MKGNKTWLWVSIVVVVVVLIGVAMWLVQLLSSPYYAVYLSTGDLYFGKLTRWPHMELSDAWYLQRDQQNNVSLSQFSKVVWKPEGNLSLNANDVVWTAPIAQDSQILPVLKGEQQPTQAATQQGVNQLPSQQGTTGSSSQGQVQQSNAPVQQNSTQQQSPTQKP